MPQTLPDLDLSYGQMLWAIGEGQEPDSVRRDQSRYLRRLGIPPSAQTPSGSGYHLRYNFYDLVETAVALRALSLRSRPKDIAAVLVNEREEFRKNVKKAWFNLPDNVLSQPWVKSRGKQRPLLGDSYFVRVHDRRSEKWGKLDVAWLDDKALKVELFDPVERFPDGESRALIPLSRLMIVCTAWALEVSNS